MDQLRRGARRTASKVARLHQRDAEPKPGALERDARADDAATDHEQVEVRLGEAVDGLSPRDLRRVH